MNDTVITIDYNGNINSEELLTYSNYIRSNIKHNNQIENTISKRNRTYYHFLKYRDRRNVSYRFYQENKIIIPDHLKEEDIRLAYAENSNLLYVIKNGLYGLYSFKNMNRVDKKTVIENNVKAKKNWDSLYIGEPLILQELLPISMDSIKHLQDHNRIIYKNELIGIYPIHNTPKYKMISLKPFGSFIRFMMPDGKKGWLDLKSNKEYFD